MESSEITECQACGYSRTNKKKTLASLAIPLPQNNYLTNIQDCMTAYTNTNILDDYKCERCNNNNTTTQHTQFNNIEQYIIITLGRASYSNKKSNNIVKVEPYIPININNKTVMFDIIGNISHKGETLNSGHYLTNIKYENKWITLNDDTKHSSFEELSAPKDTLTFLCKKSKHAVKQKIKNTQKYANKKHIFVYLL